MSTTSQCIHSVPKGNTRVSVLSNSHSWGVDAADECLISVIIYHRNTQYWIMVLIGSTGFCQVLFLGLDTFFKRKSWVVAQCCLPSRSLCTIAENSLINSVPVLWSWGRQCSRSPEFDLPGPISDETLSFISSDGKQQMGKGSMGEGPLTHQHPSDELRGRVGQSLVHKPPSLLSSERVCCVEVQASLPKLGIIANLSLGSLECIWVWNNKNRLFSFNHHLHRACFFQSIGWSQITCQHGAFNFSPRGPAPSNCSENPKVICGNDERQGNKHWQGWPWRIHL